MKLEFDEIICAPRRLGILATLVPGKPVSFTEMKAMTNLSDGNLHAQSRKLADVGYIAITKTKKGKRSVTHFSITEPGLQHLREHVAKLQTILDSEGKTKNKTTRPVARPGKSSKKQPSRRPAATDDAAVWA